MNLIGEQQRDFEARAMCYRCHKPQCTCICSHVQRVANRTRVWVAQHPRERFHPIGTERIARLGLDNVHVEIVPPRGAAVPTSLPPRAGLLYPGPDARDLATLRPNERPESLVVIDGTWSQARTLYRDNSWLRHLPCYRLTPRRESHYRLRKEPAAECVSTIEAIVEALHILEPHTPGLDDLLASFDAMIDQQIALCNQHHRGPRKPNTPRSIHGVPRALLDEPERLVAVGFEAAPRCGGGHEALAIVHFVALRIATSEVFQRFVQPPAEQFPTPRHLHHMGLRAEQLETGSTPQELRDTWRRFVAPDDITVAWNKSALDALHASVGLPERYLHLKSAYRSHAKHARGPLSALIQQLQLTPTAPAMLEGRAGEHVTNIVALLTHLHDGLAQSMVDDRQPSQPHASHG